MTGVPKAMFLPLSLSIAFAMMVSFVAAQTLVPVISVWLLKAERFQYRHAQPHAHAGLAMDQQEIGEINKHGQQEKIHPESNSFFQRLKNALLIRLTKWMPIRKWIVSFYLLIIVSLALICFVYIGKDLLPKTNSGQLQLRIREPDGKDWKLQKEIREIF